MGLISEFVRLETLHHTLYILKKMRVELFSMFQVVIIKIKENTNSECLSSAEPVKATD